MRPRTLGGQPMYPSGTQMVTYPALVNGRDVDSDRYVYAVSTSAVLADTFTTLDRKRRLERGLPDVPGPQVIGRCALADAATVEAAAAAAALAGPEGAATPPATPTPPRQLIPERSPRGRK